MMLIFALGRAWTPIVAILNRHKMPISMTEGYDPRYNGIAERVNGILKEEFRKYEEVNASNINATLERIIGVYHTKRPHESLGMLTSEQVHNGEMPGRKLWKKYGSAEIVRGRAGS